MVPQFLGQVLFMLDTSPNPSSDDWSAKHFIVIAVTNLISAAAGALGGTLVTRAFQWRHKIRFRVDKWGWYYVTQAPTTTSPANAENAESAVGFVKLGIWSDKETGTGLHGLKVEFRKGKKALFSVSPYQQQLSESRGALSVPLIHSRSVAQVNLPPREWVEVSLNFNLSKKDFPLLAESDSAWLVALAPDGKKHSHELRMNPFDVET